MIATTLQDIAQCTGNIPAPQCRRKDTLVLVGGVVLNY